MSDTSLEALAAEVGRRLQAAGIVLATAESCTGGWVAEAVTAISGSSAWFDRGFVTYTNAAKEEMLGVRNATLAAHGAVSEPVAREMAAGALARSGAGITLAITGVAGPTGGTAAKPVGMVCFGWARAGRPPESATLRFDGDRTAVRRQAVVTALEGVLERLPGSG
jgi:nicotinamide-nucleotide amidase